LGGYGFLGLAGLVFLRPGPARRLILLVFALDLLAALKLSVGDTTLIYRMGIIVAPPLFVACGALLGETWVRLKEIVDAEVAGLSSQRLRNVAPTVSRFARGLLAACIAAYLVSHLVRQASLQFPSMPRHYRQTVVGNIESVDRVAEWLNARLSPEDLLITTHIEWLFDSRTASPMLVDLAEGSEGSDVYFEGLRRRFVHPTALADADYFVMHEAMPRIAAIYKVEPLIRRIQDEWEVVYRDELIRVYARRPDGTD